MICILKRSIWSGLNIFYKGTVMETVKISDQNIQLTDVMDKGWKLDLAPEAFMDKDLVEILEGGV
jgi:hypothetical protein